MSSLIFLRLVFPKPPLRLARREHIVNRELQQRLPSRSLTLHRYGHGAAKKGFTDACAHVTFLAQYRQQRSDR